MRANDSTELTFDEHLVQIPTELVAHVADGRERHATGEHRTEQVGQTNYPGIAKQVNAEHGKRLRVEPTRAATARLSC